MNTRMIDAVALLNHISTIQYQNENHMFTYDEIKKLIMDTPTRYGKWIKQSSPDDNGDIICSCSLCDALEEMCIYAFDKNEVQYCWRCGATMTGGEQDAQN